MIVIGLTGNLGAGKTTVAGMFERLGARVLDADKIARGLIESSGTCFKPVVKAFGKDILLGKEIDRRKLAAVVFNDQTKLQKLNKLIHPKVIKIIKEEISRIAAKPYHRSISKAKQKKAPVVIIEAALLIESGLHELATEVILVKANRRLQIERATHVKNMSKSEAIKRIRMQMSIKEKMKYADIVIDTRGSLNKTNRQVEDIWEKIIQRNRTK